MFLFLIRGELRKILEKISFCVKAQKNLSCLLQIFKTLFTLLSNVLLREKFLSPL